ncbi:hypothetical protein SAMN04488005_2850 [Yoonia tamlensis]|uniref:Ferrochelatase n=1 Tax=Yoonia tamlensis TaxID=390270 RepID=A0A1I6HMJ8_9RHOB|nr:hypothetical protein [Yoonia tamlensis]SFR55567.1 hypothetical protein SAMN04488005_2850 [Yoonia tamlensis]
MRLTTTLAAAAALAVSAVSAQAGGMTAPVMDAPVEVAAEPAPAGSSVNSAFIVIGVIAALLIASQLGDDED